MTFLPLLPPWLILAIGAALVILLLHGCRTLRLKNVALRWVAGLTVLRLAAIAVFLLCLWRPIVPVSETVERRPDLLVLCDTSASMDASDGTISRLEEVRREMETVDFFDSLTAAFDIHWFAFDVDARPIESMPDSTESCSGESTALARSLNSAWAHYRQTAQSSLGIEPAPPAILLISDGNDLGATDPAETARSLAAPVYAAHPPEPPGTALPPSVEIVNLQASSRVLLGSECRFLAGLRHRNAQGIPLLVTLTEDGQPVAERELTLSANVAETQLTLTHRPTSLGPKKFELRVEVPDGDGKMNPPEPSDITVNVVGKNNKVLVLEDTWRWDFKFLRRLLEDDPSFTFTSFLSRGSGIYVQFAEPDRSVQLAGFPRSATELGWFDIIVLGDVVPEQWPESLAPALHRSVVEDGKSLLIIAGPSLGNVVRNPYLESLLPVELAGSSAVPLPGPIRIEPTPDGLASPFFYTPGTRGNAVDWTQLPEMDQVYPPARKRPAATILLEALDRANAYGNLIVMAEHTVGRGRVIYLGTDSLWKWQTLAPAEESGATPYTVFWQQTLRALAPSRANLGQVNLWLQPDRSKYRLSETVSLEATLEGLRAGDNAAVEARVDLPGGREVPLPLLPDQRRQHVYRAEFEAASAGQHQISAVAIQDGRTIADTSVVIDVEPLPDEAEQRQNNLVLLSRLTASTGGRMVDLSEPETWPSADAREPSEVHVAHALDLWSNFTLLVLLVLLLGLDWLLRLLHGFV